MGLTNKGKLWEFLNSLWIIFSFVMLLHYVGFFWIGIRTKTKKWVLFGLVYFLLCFILPTYASGLPDGVLKDIMFTVYIISWIVCIVHSFFCRKEYLLRREAILNARPQKYTQLRQKIQAEYNYSNKPEPQAVQYEQPEAPPDIKIDINTCGEQQLSTLPGIGAVKAKKALMIRTQKGGFSSFDDFIMALELEPHFAVQIESLIVVQPINEIQKNTGRILDI